MIQLLFTLIFSEMAIIVIFVFKTPLRKLVIMALDRVKRGQAPIIVKTVAGTLFVVMLSTIYSVVSIYNRWTDENGDITPTDQILAAQNLLEASLMGFSLFLAFMIDRLHHYIRELNNDMTKNKLTTEENPDKDTLVQAINNLPDKLGKLIGTHQTLIDYLKIPSELSLAKINSELELQKQEITNLKKGQKDIMEKLNRIGTILGDVSPPVTPSSSKPPRLTTNP